MRKILPVFLFIVLASITNYSVPAKAEAVSYYVSPGGSDTNAGSLASPWKTINKAAATAKAGDTVYIRAGTYRERLRPANSGTQTAPLIFTAYPGEEHQAVLDLGEMTGTNSYLGIVHISGKSYITVSDLRLLNSGMFGVFVGQSNNILIKNNQVNWTWSSGIYLENSKSVVADGNDLQRVTHMQGSSSPHESISILGGTDGFEIMNNKIYNTNGTNTKEGIDCKDSCSNGKIHHNYVNLSGRKVGIYVDAYATYSRDVEIYNNEVDSAGNGMVVTAEQRGTASNIKIYNNIVRNNTYYGIRIAKFDLGGYTNNISVINNTFYNNASYGIEVSNTEIQNVIIRNNISLGNGSGNYIISSQTPGSQIIADHNLISGDAKFVNASSGDFRLSNGSPAIDSGSPDGAPLFDYAGNKRPAGAAFDMGIYEYGSTGGDGNPSNGTPTPTPVTPTVGSGTNTAFILSLKLHGLGSGGDNANEQASGNFTPIHPARTVTADLYNSLNQLISTKQTTVNLNSSNGLFTGSVFFDLTNGSGFQLKVRSSQYLARFYPGIILPSSAQIVNLPQLSLITGDTNNDNQLSVLDYNIILDCFADLGLPRNCTDANKKIMSDLTDDGKVDQFDYNLFLRELSVQVGI